jgi:AcrR family transcriptional regulator
LKARFLGARAVVDAPMARRNAIAPKLPPRPKRGPPEETRERLVHAAAEIFNREGYGGTDSNRIAKEAGYAPGTFYKHFTDKRDVFLAVYEEWVAREWRDVSATIAAEGTVGERAERIVETFLEHHRRWRGFRASLRALVASDSDVRAFYRKQRRRQLELLARLRAGRAGSREADALLLFTLERVADALADGEAEALQLRSSEVHALIVALVRARLAAADRE